MNSYPPNSPPCHAKELTMSRIPAELIAAYLYTEYRAFAEKGDMVLRIGEPSAELAGLFARTGRSGAAFITAENPFSQALPAEENAARQAALCSDLTALGATIYEGEGRGEDPSWPAEASFLVVGLARNQACELGRKYQQNAFVWVGCDAVPQLNLLHYCPLKMSPI